MVSSGGSAALQTDWYGGDCECPFVLARDGRYCLFRNQRYGADSLNTQYVSPDPLDFGVDDDRYLVGRLPVAAPEIIEHGGHQTIASLMPSLKGIHLAELGWEG